MHKSVLLTGKRRQKRNKDSLFKCKIIPNTLKIIKKRSDVVVNACNPSYLGARDRRTAVQGQPGQIEKKISKPLSQKTVWVW
jgi:hypothetical protein